MVTHRVGLSHGRHYVADRGEETPDPSQSSVIRRDRAGAPRSQRNQDCRDAEPHSGFAASATSRADRTRPADPATGRRSAWLSAVSAVWCRWYGRTAVARRPDPGRAEEASLRLTVLIECRTELSQTSGECAGRGNRDNPRRSGPAPFEPRHLADRPTLEGHAALFGFTCATPKRVRGSNKGSKGGNQKSCRRVGGLRQCGGRKNLPTV